MLVVFTRCDTPQSNIDLKNGDLFFCSYPTGELTGAIDKVTQTRRQNHFAHVGIIELSATDTSIIHASTKKGVNKEKLTHFLKNEGANYEVYRLKPEFQKHVEAALLKANSLLGMPYNFSYVLSDSSYYCSQLMYEIFEDHCIFNLEPMTFKDPETGTFHSDWVKYYEKLNIAIPEGEPGCNPNGLAASDALVDMGRYTQK